MKLNQAIAAPLIVFNLINLAPIAALSNENEPDWKFILTAAHAQCLQENGISIEGIDLYKLFKANGLSIDLQKYLVKDPYTKLEIKNLKRGGCKKVSRWYEEASWSHSLKDVRSNSNQVAESKPEANNLRVDMFGYPAIPGWTMKNMPQKNGVVYTRISPNGTFWKVNVRGDSNRYIGQQTLLRQYEAPRRAIAPTSTQITKGTTSCNIYGSSANCTHTPGITSRTPGRAGRTGGVVQYPSTWVYDCKDKTRAIYSDSFSASYRPKWRKMDSSSYSRIAKACDIRSKLTVLPDFEID